MHEADVEAIYAFEYFPGSHMPHTVLPAARKYSPGPQYRQKPHRPPGWPAHCSISGDMQLVTQRNELNESAENIPAAHIEHVVEAPPDA